jgi:hypothetical protein
MEFDAQNSDTNCIIPSQLPNIDFKITLDCRFLAYEISFFNTICSFPSQPILPPNRLHLSHPHIECIHVR